MGPGEHRPHNEEYWQRPWARALFAGDLFVLVPVLPLDLVIRQTAAIEQSLGLLRSRDAITPYMYLPALPDIFESEQVACLFRPTLVSDELLRDPPRRVAQLQPAARRQLKVKLAAYWGRAAVNADDLPLNERDEAELAAGTWPPSAYDSPSAATGHG